jgi:hypothetical protein
MPSISPRKEAEGLQAELQVHQVDLQVHQAELQVQHTEVQYPGDAEMETPVFCDMLITHPTLLETITCIFSSENNFNR